MNENELDIEIPDMLETSGTKLIYLYLSIKDEATIDELHTELGIKKITLYPLLQQLTTINLVDQLGSTYVCQEPREQPRDRGD